MRAAEDLGFAGLYRSDHFTNSQPPDCDSLELIVSLTYLADHTQRIQFGPLVAPLTFRHPALLARQAAALDDLSGGRLILGVGAGWQTREHRLFGFELGDRPTRVARLEEGLQVITGLLRHDEPWTFEGRYFQVRDAILLPRPQRPGGPRVLVGGNGVQRTLPLVACYAEACDGMGLSPAAFRERMRVLDEALRAVGRQPSAVTRTLMLGSIFARSEGELEHKLAHYRAELELCNKPLEAVVDALVARGNALIGTPEHITGQLAAYDQAGVEEVMVQWLDWDDLDGL